MKYSFLLYIAIAVLFLAPLTKVSSQFDPGVVATIKANPAYPGAYENVTLTLESFFISLEGASIQWQQGTTILKEGIGAVTLPIQTGAIGEPVTIEAVITEASGKVSRTRITIIPSSVDLIWEASGYTPYFYKGKSLPTADSTVRFVAMPHIADTNGTLISESNLVYTWKSNGATLGDRSGYGKQTLTLPVSPRRLNVEVEISKRTGERVARAQTFIDPVEPELLVYKNDPLLGIIDAQEVGNAFIDVGSEITISLFPFFFPEKDVIYNSLEYSWYMNGSPLVGKTRDVTLRKGDQAGQARFQVRVKNNMSLFQEVEKIFSIRLLSHE